MSTLTNATYPQVTSLAGTCLVPLTVNGIQKNITPTNLERGLAALEAVYPTAPLTITTNNTTVGAANATILQAAINAAAAAGGGRVIPTAITLGIVHLAIPTADAVAVDNVTAFYLPSNVTLAIPTGMTLRRANSANCLMGTNKYLKNATGTYGGTGSGTTATMDHDICICGGGTIDPNRDNNTGDSAFSEDIMWFQGVNGLTVSDLKIIGGGLRIPITCHFISNFKFERIYTTQRGVLQLENGIREGVIRDLVCESTESEAMVSLGITTASAKGAAYTDSIIVGPTSNQGTLTGGAGSDVYDVLIENCHNIGTGGGTVVGLHRFAAGTNASSNFIDLVTIRDVGSLYYPGNGTIVNIEDDAATINQAIKTLVIENVKGGFPVSIKSGAKSIDVRNATNTIGYGTSDGYCVRVVSDTGYYPTVDSLTVNGLSIGCTDNCSGALVVIDAGTYVKCLTSDSLTLIQPTTGSNAVVISQLGTLTSCSVGNVTMDSPRANQGIMLNVGANAAGNMAYTFNTVHANNANNIVFGSKSVTVNINNLVLANNGIVAYAPTSGITVRIVGSGIFQRIGTGTTWGYSDNGGHFSVNHAQAVISPTIYAGGEQTNTLTPEAWDRFINSSTALIVAGATGSASLGPVIYDGSAWQKNGRP